MSSDACQREILKKNKKCGSNAPLKNSTFLLKCMRKTWKLLVICQVRAKRSQNLNNRLKPLKNKTVRRVSSICHRFDNFFNLCQN